MDDRYTLHHGDCIEVMRGMADNSVDAIVTDPPYGLEFMGKDWDSFKTYNGGNPNMKPQGPTAQHDGDSVFAATSYGYRQKNPRCRNCGKLKRGNGHCKCPSPQWDTRTSESAFQFQCFTEDWAREAWRILKPGGYLLAFGGSRTYHRLASGIEDAGFEIRDQLQWIFGSGFPKSLDVSKAIDRAAGAEREVVGVRESIGYPDGGTAVERNRAGTKGSAIGIEVAAGGVPITAPATPAAQQWQGWGTALKPAHEPIVLARKPLIGTVAANVLAHGTGALNIDGCRVGADPETFGVGQFGPSKVGSGSKENQAGNIFGAEGVVKPMHPQGRWPANVIHDGSDEVVAGFPDSKGGAYPAKRGQAVATTFASGQETEGGYRAMGDSGSAARFFYCAKASKRDRNEGLEGTRNGHPTVKPCALMQYLIRLTCPPDGIVLDPFMGSGSTGKAAMFEGVNFIGIEQDADYLAIAEARIRWALSQPLEEVIFPRPSEPTEAELEQLAFPIEQAGEASA